VKVGDLLKHNGNHSLWLLVEVDFEEKYSEAPYGLGLVTRRNLLVVSAKTGYKMWASTRAFKVVSKCQENVKSAPNDLQSPSQRVTL